MEPQGQLTRTRDPRHLRSRVIAGAVAVGAFGLAIVLARGAFMPRPVKAPVNVAWSSYAEGWTELPPPPEWRDGAALVWAGDRLLDWGGVPKGSDRTHGTANGSSFDPATRVWSAIPSAPRPGVGAIPIWTGLEALFLSIDDQGVRGQAFDPISATWRTLPNGPRIPEYGVSVAWTGQEVVLFGGGQVGAASDRQGWAFDPRSDDWRQLPDAPIGMNLSDAVWTGSEVVVVGSALDGRHEATSPTALAERYDPSNNRWRVLPAPPISAQTSSVAVIDGTLVAWELYGPDAVEWLEDEGRWRSLDMGGLSGGECYATGVVVDGSLFTWNCGTPAAWFSTNGVWANIGRPVEAASGFDYSFGETIPAGDAVVVDEIETIAGSHGEPYVGSSSAPEHLWTWKPPSVAPWPTWTATKADAVDLVGSFLSDWHAGWEAFLPATATSDVIARCRVGEGDLVALDNGAVPDWDLPSAPTTFDGDTFDVPVQLLRDHRTIGTEIFTVGPGTTADGRQGQLVITDVRPA